MRRPCSTLPLALLLVVAATVPSAEPELGDGRWPLPFSWYASNGVSSPTGGMALPPDGHWLLHARHQVTAGEGGGHQERWQPMLLKVSDRFRGELPVAAVDGPAAGEPSGALTLVDLSGGPGVPVAGVGEPIGRLRWTRDGRFFYWSAERRATGHRRTLVWDRKRSRQVAEIDGAVPVGTGPGPSSMVLAGERSEGQDIVLHDAARDQRWTVGHAFPNVIDAEGGRGALDRPPRRGRFRHRARRDRLVRSPGRRRPARAIAASRGKLARGTAVIPAWARRRAGTSPSRRRSPSTPRRLERPTGPRGSSRPGRGFRPQQTSRWRARS